MFISNFWQELFKLSGTTLVFSSAYHPESDRQTEVVNQSLETYLRCFTSDKQAKWSNWILWAEYWFNTNFNQSIGMSPFKALYGQDPPTIFKLEDVESSVEDVNQHIRDRNALIEELKGHLVKALETMKRYADKNRRDISFENGELVYVKLRPYRLKSLAKKINEKLSA